MRLHDPDDRENARRIAAAPATSHSISAAESVKADPGR
jgi:hypothetical protein